MDPDRRARLVEKGRRLVTTYCRLDGETTCVDGFVDHHLARGEAVVVQDLLARLQQMNDTAVESLVNRIKEKLEALD